MIAFLHLISLILPDSQGNQNNSGKSGARSSCCGWHLRDAVSTDPALDGAADLPFGRAALDRFPLVVRPLALHQSELYLGAAVFEIEAEGDERQPLLGGLPLEVGYFTPVEKEFSFPKRIGVFAVAEFVGADVGVAEENFAAGDHAVAVADVRLPPPERLHLGPLEGDPGLERLYYMVVVPGLPVSRNQLRLCHGGGIRKAIS